MNKIAVITTFPSGSFNVYARYMLGTFWQCWPNDVELYIQLDEDKLAEEIVQWLRNERKGIEQNPTYGIDNNIEEHKEFLSTHAGKDDPKNYREQPLRFCHKVFSLLRMARESEGVKYLIWLDADVVTLSPFEMDALEKWLPKDKLVTYLGRKDWNTPETGLMIFDLDNGGRDFIERMAEIYISGEIMSYPEKTDAFVFQKVLAEWNEANKRDVGFNISEDIAGRDVFEASPFGQYMKHYKGPKKMDIAKDFTIIEGDKIPKESQPGVHSYYGAKDSGSQMHGTRVDLDKLHIHTKNCVDNSVIVNNVRKNLKLIKNWVNKALKVNEEEIVICSAGPSLNSADIKPYYDRGVKIVAVKHALDKLMDDGIIPWACILLDPRAHVADFVKYPHQDITWFVASMVDPAVTEHLLKSGCNVIGYHAVVGAGETEELRAGDLLIEGGSATATRGISLLEALGFREMHLYGYDACYLKQPDLREQKENGRLKFEEVTIGINSWRNIQEVRTVWTEGQFMAQVQEFRTLYFPKEHIKYHTYGYGLIPWVHEHLKKEKAWKEYVTKAMLKQHDLENAQDINEFINGTVRKSCNIT